MVSGNRSNHILELKETPFSIGEGRFLMSRRAFLYIEETPLSFANNSFYSPLHSERGRGGGSIWALGEAGWGNLKPITPLEETNLLEFFLHTCFLFIGHVLEGNTVRSEVETEQFHDALTAYDVTTEVTDNIDHCL